MFALHTDLYQLTMAAGYFHRGMVEQEAVCEMFVRRLPKPRRYLVAMGLGPLLSYFEGLAFTEPQIEFLREAPALRDAMTPAFCDYLRAFRFTGDVDAVPEGTIVFANEPLVRVTAPMIEAQLVETYLLSIVNHATMVASKAARIVRTAAPATCVEFGSRRTHPGEAVDAARAACAAGFVGTSNVEAGLRYGLSIVGTAAHIWTMAHPSEEAAFRSYVEVFPNASILLIDTYDTLRGAERAAHIAKDKLRGVRLDSGDLLALSREVRKILDANGCAKTQIVASGDLNEYKIAALRAENAPIDVFGVGTDLVTSLDAPSLGGVYKLVELRRSRDAAWEPIAKFSSGKATLPGSHQVWRFAGGDGQGFSDVIALSDERAEDVAVSQRTSADRATPLLVPVVRAGKRVAPPEAISTIRDRVSAGLAALPEAAHALGEGPPAIVATPSARLAALVEQVKERVVGG